MNIKFLYNQWSCSNDSEQALYMYIYFFQSVIIINEYVQQWSCRTVNRLYICISISFKVL